MSTKRNHLARLKGFAVRLAEEARGANRAVPPGRILEFPSVAFSQEGLGAVSLFGDDAKEYREIINQLQALNPDKVSSHAVARAVQDALLQTIDINGLHKGTTVEDRAKSAQAHVDKLLSASAKSWSIGIPVTGLKPGSQPWEIGIFSFVAPDHPGLIDLINRADSITDRTTASVGNKQHVKEQYRQKFMDAHHDKAFMIIQIDAVDGEAAWQSAKRHARFILDCFNLAIEAISGSGQFYALSDAEPARSHHRVGLLVGNDSATLESEVDSTAGTMECDQLRERVKETSWLARMMQYLSEAHRTAHQDRILSAAHWAGRAAADRRSDQAFLSRAIALESLLLGHNDGEISKSLALSVTHLLGDWLADREKTFVSIKRLYKVRSQIVHSGTYVVDRADAALLRQYLHACFARLLDNPTFFGMSGAKELDDWLHLSILGARSTDLPGTLDS